MVSFVSRIPSFLYHEIFSFIQQTFVEYQLYAWLGTQNWAVNRMDMVTVPINMRIKTGKTDTNNPLLLKWLVLQRRNSRIHRKVQQRPDPMHVVRGEGRVFWDIHVWGTEGWVGIGQVKGRRRSGESLLERGNNMVMHLWSKKKIPSKNWKKSNKKITKEAFFLSVLWRLEVLLSC